MESHGKWGSLYKVYSAVVILFIFVNEKARRENELVSHKMDLQLFTNLKTKDQ